MTLVRWQPIRPVNPFEGISMLQRRMNRLFDESLNDETEELQTSWEPRIDLLEVGDHFEVTAELPGLTHDEVKVELHENMLTISGEKQSVSNKKDRNFYISERSFGQFRRNFQFPTRIDHTKIDAEFKDGVLTVTLPKAEDAKPKQIEVKVH